MAEDILANLRDLEPHRQVRAVIQPGLVVRGDRSLLRILLENLLSNAWKYTGRRDEARIELGARAENGHQVFFVRDNGVGFDMAHVGHLFQPFHRLHAMTAFPGTGIGLATVERIVRRHGGRVWAEGELGKGATFSFVLGT